MQNSPLKLTARHSTSTSATVGTSTIHSVVTADTSEDRDDEIMTETTDDPIADAFEHLNQHDLDDDDEEEVLYPR